MSIILARYHFEGPFRNTDNLKSLSGVYAILGRNTAYENWSVIDIGESSNVRERVSTHDRKDCWNRQGFNDLQVAAYYCSEAERMRIEKELRNQFNPLCGKV